MAATTTITIASSLFNGQTVSNNVLSSSDGHQVCTELARLLTGVASGSNDARVTVSVNEGNNTKASGTITCDQSAAVADDTVTIGGVVLTAKASGAVANEFNIGADDEELATNLAAAINAQASLSQFLSASSVAAVVTITASFEGVAGNGVTLVTDNATAFTLSGAALTGATSTSVQVPLTFNLGLA